MLTLIRSSLAPLLSLVLLIMGSGLFGTFVPLRLEIEGHSPETIGFVISSLYLGILIGSLRMGRFIARVGHVRAFEICALGSCAIVLAQAIWVDPWYWAILRLIGGIAMAGIFVAIESWLLMQSAASNRGAMLSLYLGVFYGAMTLGQFLINLSDPAGIAPFFITAGLSALSIVPLLLTKPSIPKIENPVHLNCLQLFRLSPLGFMGGIISGMILAVVYGLVPVYAREMSLSVAGIGNLMATIIFGGLFLQWPLGRLADRGERRKVLYIASFLAAMFSLLIALINSSSALLFCCAGIFGGFSFALYPLSMAYTCERVDHGQIVAATSGFVMSYGIGAIAGPLLAPLAMIWFGAHGLFYFLAFISVVLGLAGLKRPKSDKCFQKITNVR